MSARRRARGAGLEGDRRDVSVTVTECYRSPPRRRCPRHRARSFPPRLLEHAAANPPPLIARVPQTVMPRPPRRTNGGGTSTRLPTAARRDGLERLNPSRSSPRATLPEPGRSAIGRREAHEPCDRQADRGEQPANLSLAPCRQPRSHGATDARRGHVRLSGTASVASRPRSHTPSCLPSVPIDLARYSSRPRGSGA